MPTHILRSAKAYCALIGAIATGLLGIYGPETPAGQVLAIVLAVTTAVVTWRVPNATPPTVTSKRILGKAVMSPLDERPRHKG